jgi:hypothetical protein
LNKIADFNSLKKIEEAKCGGLTNKKFIGMDDSELQEIDILPEENDKDKSMGDEEEKVNDVIDV